MGRLLNRLRTSSKRRPRFLQQALPGSYSSRCTDLPTFYVYFLKRLRPDGTTKCNASQYCDQITKMCMRDLGATHPTAFCRSLVSTHSAPVQPANQLRGFAESHRCERACGGGHYRISVMPHSLRRVWTKNAGLSRVRAEEQLVNLECLDFVFAVR